MDIKLLQYFVDVTEENNITKVAEKHYISQPALTLQMQKLEEAYGTKLLSRTMRGVEPTEAGRLLVDYCKNILHIYNQSFEEIANLAEKRQTIRIESNLTLATYALPFLIYELQKQDYFINCHFDLTFHTSNSVESNILSGTSHIGFVQSVKSNPNIVYEKITIDHLILVAAQRYRIEDTISLEQLNELPLIVAFDKFQERTALRDTLAKYNVSMTDLNVAMTLHSTESVKTALFGGIGVAMLPYLSVKKEIIDGTLKEIQITDFKEEYPIYLTYLKEKNYNTNLEHAIDFLKTEAKAYL